MPKQPRLQRLQDFEAKLDSGCWFGDSKGGKTVAKHIEAPSSSNQEISGPGNFQAALVSWKEVKSYPSIHLSNMHPSIFYRVFFPPDSRVDHERW